MSAVPDSSLREQLLAAIEASDYGEDNGPYYWSGVIAAVLPVVEAGLAAARADEREKIEAVRQLLQELAPPEPLVQDEQGGCVWCGASGRRSSLDPPKLDDHGPECPYLLARVCLARSVGAEPNPKAVRDGSSDASFCPSRADRRLFTGREGPPLTCCLPKNHPGSHRDKDDSMRAAHWTDSLATSDLRGSGEGQVGSRNRGHPPGVEPKEQ